MQELDFVRKRFMLDLDDKQAADKYGHNTLDDIHPPSSHVRLA